MWESVLKPELHRALPGMLPRAIVELLTLRGLEKVGPRARVAGGLWGAGYDIPVAATLRGKAEIITDFEILPETVGSAFKNSADKITAGVGE